MADANKSQITLPSRGVLYADQVPEGKVLVRKMALREMQMLESGGGGIEKIGRIIEDCLTLPGGEKSMAPKKLLLTDRLAVLLAIRTFTFGTQYNYTFRCRFCQATNKAEMNIAEELSQKMAPDDLKEPFEVILPDCGRTVGLRFLRGDDESRIAQSAKRMKLQSTDADDPSLLYRITAQLVNVDGVELKGAEKEAFARGLSARDLLKVVQATDDKEPGVDLKIVATCRTCQGDNEMSMPFDAEFFRPSRV